MEKQERTVGTPGNMLFNSYEFLLIFLPLALLGYQVAGRFHRDGVVIWLGFMSLVFYAYWRPALLYILLTSIAFNYVAASLISRRIPTRIGPGAWLTFAIVINLGALGYFKYLFPSLNFLSAVTGATAHWADVVLPLGISFFTFTQIAFLIDLRQGIARQQDLASYVLFVTFFPHLIAGPILHHKEMMPQFQQVRRYRLSPSDLAVGFSWFIMGLGKKVLFADNLGHIADPVFAAHEPLSAASAWIGALAYCLQLYFDFSGYSDMALGLARMFSINFPLNFNSPFKAPSIIDFWQRWHITLSNYVMSYLYVPMQMWVRRRRQATGKGVSRKDMFHAGAFTSLIALPMMFALLIAGIWHGAGFQFVIYGLLHGTYLTVNHAWRLLISRRAPPAAAPIVRRVLHGGAVLLTFICVLVSFVFFRSRGVAQAVSVLASMTRMVPAGSHPVPAAPRDAIEVVVFFAAVWLLPNTQEILSRFKPSLQETAWIAPDFPRPFLWFPNIGWGLGLGGVLFLILFEMQDPSKFLYFQF